MNKAVIETVWKRLPKPRQGFATKPPLPFTTDEFKERIKAIVGPRNGPSNPLVTRTPTDKGYYK